MAEGVQIVWTPWRHHGELVRNRAWLYPDMVGEGREGDGGDMRRRACDQISAWKLRGALPHAVESSWLLTEAVLIDEMPGGQVPIFAIKAAYITAISRFVTGLLDSQQESKYKISMYTTAAQIGLPALFVDMRHEATHGDMPSLMNLRGAARKALRWLWDDYWVKIGGGKGVGEVGSKGEGVLDGDVLGLGEGDGNDGEGHGDAAAENGGWKKWQGRWTARPIGTVGNS